ncbi:hypothetical protein SLEP1_g86 [Rubroshorea leprosula]|uniref:Uncharacterized protein n=1 Tax=Rubroshorea leprosula TaxID=152421 RepID=A0AAV5HFZ7_9ROSI|nr:hypothetical protein SLEP1_g86 [Rubroshorea leprosula]
MAYQKDHLLKVGKEGFQLIETYHGWTRGRPGPAIRHPPPVEEPEYLSSLDCTYVYQRLKTNTVLQEPQGINSTTYVCQVPAAKQAYPAPFPASKDSSNLIPTTKGHDGWNSYQPIARPKESEIKGNGTGIWYVYKVTEIPAEGDVITGEEHYW